MKVNSRVIKDIDPKKLQELRKLFGNQPTTVNVGFPASAGTHDDAGVPVATVAAFHEFGTERTPERSFLRGGIRNNRGEHLRMSRQLLKKVVSDAMPFSQALGLLGEAAKGFVQKEITNGDFVPLTEATIRRKGSTKPLIDSGQMRQSVAWEYGDD